MNTKEFTELYYRNRRNTGNVKWDMEKAWRENDNLLSLWIADMEFSAPPCINEALKERAEHGIYGYSIPGRSYYEAFFSWMEKYQGVEYEKEWVRFAPNVLTSLNYVIEAFSEEGDAILVQPPVYHPFFSAITDTKRRRIDNKLIYDNKSFIMDYENMEEIMKTEKVKIFILCSPHNPVGRVWSEEELERVLELCRKYHVLPVVDEIHGDLILEDHKFISALGVKNGNYKEDIILLNSPSKPFNIAGLSHSHVIIPHKEKAEIYDKYTDRHNRAGLSLMGLIATEAAYKNGRTWLTDLLKVIEENYIFIKDGLKETLPEAEILDLQGTYLAFINLQFYIEEIKKNLSKEESEKFNIKEYLYDKADILVNEGGLFSSDTASYIRVNLATRKEDMKELLKRLTKLFIK